MNPLPPEKLLLHMETPSHRGVFILGCLERRVTLYSQQVRALNLAHALLALGRLAPGDPVLVVGGGAGGLTAAAGLALRGCKVTLLEKRDELLPLFSGNGTRWLHPHIYDWPAPDSTRERAGLPVLDWKADLANKVAEQLLDAWRPLEKMHGIDVHLQVDNITPEWGNEPPHPISWNTSSGYHSDSFKAVLLAVGFGLEKQHSVVEGKPYWVNDGLHQSIDLPQKKDVHVLVSGTGDGGLVDLFRLKIKSFQHDRIVTDFLSQSVPQELSEALLDIEKRLRLETLSPEALYESYWALKVPQELDEGLKQRLRERVHVALNGMSKKPLTPDASILNRFLASRLLRLGVTYHSGELGTVKKTGEGFEVTFRGGPQTFDRIVVRHGPESALERDFPELRPQCVGLRERNRLDETRVPIWEAGAFEKEPSAHAVVGGSSPRPSASARLPERIRFIGREKELKQLVDAITSEPPCPMVVLGTAGIGKSALTIAALHAPPVEARYGHRRYFARLDGANTAEALLLRLADVLGVNPGPDLPARVETRLSEAPALLVLDNTETPWEVEPEATEALLQKLAGLAGLALVISVRGSVAPKLGSLVGQSLQVPPWRKWRHASCSTPSPPTRRTMLPP